MRKPSEKREIIGHAYHQLKELVEKYATSDLPVLFAGETGSGKEEFAKLYMRLNPRSRKKMAVNCAGLPQELLWSEVFGHIVGAFTTAVRRRDGLIKTCDKGILFLDELGEASTQFQAAILRVAEQNSFKPLGSDLEETSIDTLIIGATNNLSGIREDLKKRFHILPVPPLQKEDIPVLAQHFYEGKVLKRNILEDLMSREFAGNVRELKQECERLLSEKGEDIFYKGKRAPDLGIVNDLFDYERFYGEFFLWEKHVSPIVQKYQLDFRYKYFPLPEQTAPELTQKYWDITLALPGEPIWKPYDPIEFRRMFREREFGKRVAGAWKDMPRVIKHLQLRENEQESIILFNYYLDIFFEIPDLNSFLHTFPNHTEIPNQKPDLRSLLDFNPTDALRNFKEIYYNYVLQQHNGSKADAAKALKINPNTLKSALRSLRIKKE